jgi:hypothetical protein
MTPTDYTEEIAKIERITLGREDHGIFTCMLHLNFGSSGQGAGGYELDEPIHEGEEFVRRQGTAFGMEWIIRAMDACGVDDWSKVQGRTVLALRDPSTFSLVGIKPLPTEHGKLFLFDALAKEHYPAKAS